MNIIDAHIHYSDIESFRQTAEEISFLDYSKKGLVKECKKANVTAAVGMGLTEREKWGFPDYRSTNPMGLDLEPTKPDFLFECPGINPVMLENDPRKELENIEKELSRPDVVGMKVYAGYYHYYVFDKIYDPVYRLAMEYDLAVIIHSGATYSDRGLLKYSHPLTVDELSYKYRKLNFVICHMGDPWVMDTAVTVAKNPNVYADLSGLVVADEVKIGEVRKNNSAMERISSALVYSESYHKYLFGSDWPLAKIKPYIDFVGDLVPQRYHKDVFYNNACNVFPKIESALQKVE